VQIHECKPVFQVAVIDTDFPTNPQEFQEIQGQDTNWRVGVGGITKEQVLLIGAVHVSQGSWQPILQLNRYVMPRYQHLPGLP